MQVEKVELTDTQGLILIIESINEILERIRENSESYKKLLNDINNIIQRLDNWIDNGEKDPRMEKDLNYFYMLHVEKQNVTEKINLKYEKLLQDTYEYIFFNISRKEIEKKVKNEIDISNSVQIKEDNKKENIEELTIEAEDLTQLEAEIQPCEHEDIANNKDYLKDTEQTNIEEEKGLEKNEEQNINNELKDNDTLTISEMKNKVFLPYKVDDLKKMKEQEPEKYKSIQDIIDIEYTLPLDRYKNATLSRFKEAYHLMRDREKATFSKSIDLALEVMFKYNLNPAIITACKNLDEFDVYLDCLEENNLEDFKIFNIKYEIAPMKI